MQVHARPQPRNPQRLHHGLAILFTWKIRDLRCVENLLKMSADELIVEAHTRSAFRCTPRLTKESISQTAATFRNINID